MAGTIVLGSFDDGKVQFEMDYDDNLDVITFRCRNDSEQRAYGLLQRANPTTGVTDDMQYGLESPAGEITTIALPQGREGIRLVAGNKPGRFGGYITDMRFPF